MNKTDWLKLIKRYFLRKWKVRLGLSLIGLGVSLLFFDWAEIILIVLEKSIESQESNLLIVVKYIVCSSLIIAGILVLLSVFFDEKRAKYFTVKLIAGKNYISWIGDKNNNNPKYSFQIPIMIENGRKPCRILSIHCKRYVEGLTCSLSKPEFKIYKSVEEKKRDQETWISELRLKVNNGDILLDQVDEEFNRRKNSEYNYPFLSDYKNLSKQPRLTEHENQKFTYQRLGTGPTSLFDCERLENAEYELIIEYSFDGEGSDIKKVLIDQKDGYMKETTYLSSPPRLNNDLLKTGVQNGVITQKEKNALMKETTEEQSYSLLLEGENYLMWNRNINKQHLKLCREVNKKLLDYEMYQHTTKDMK